MIKHNSRLREEQGSEGSSLGIVEQLLTSSAHGSLGQGWAGQAAASERIREGAPCAGGASAVAQPLCPPSPAAAAQHAAPLGGGATGHEGGGRDGGRVEGTWTPSSNASPAPACCCCWLAAWITDHGAAKRASLVETQPASPLDRQSVPPSAVWSQSPGVYVPYLHYCSRADWPRACDAICAARLRPYVHAVACYCGGCLSLLATAVSAAGLACCAVLCCCCCCSHLRSLASPRLSPRDGRPLPSCDSDYSHAGDRHLTRSQPSRVV